MEVRKICLSILEQLMRVDRVIRQNQLKRAVSEDTEGRSMK